MLISHDHYDHLDMDTDRPADAHAVDAVRRAARHRRPPAALGRARRTGSSSSTGTRAADLDGLTLTCTEARHFSGRLFATNPTLWSSWLVEADGRTAFFGGDSGYTEAFADLGEAHGPVDLTVLPIGAYDVRWPDVHMDPEEAVQTHLDVSGGVLLPIHWATFDLAFHPWREPAERVRAAAAEHGVRLAQPRPGERFEVGRRPAHRRPGGTGCDGSVVSGLICEPLRWAAAPPVARSPRAPRATTEHHPSPPP